MWSDERLDDLSKRMDGGFERMECGFGRVDTDIRELRMAMVQVATGIVAAMIVGFLGVIAAVLAGA